MLEYTKDRYTGTRWAVLYGRYEGAEALAVNELQARLQEYVPYTLEVRPAAPPAGAPAEHLAVIGTAQSNRLLAELLRRKVVPAPPERAEGYSLAIAASP